MDTPIIRAASVEQTEIFSRSACETRSKKFGIIRSPLSSISCYFPLDAPHLLGEVPKHAQTTVQPPLLGLLACNNVRGNLARFLLRHTLVRKAGKRFWQQFLRFVFLRVLSWSFLWARKYNRVSTVLTRVFVKSFLGKLST